MFRLQFRHGFYLLAIAGLVFYLEGSVSGRDNGSPQSSTSLQALPACDSLAGPQPNWPLWLGVQQTAKVKASFTSWGTFGLNIEYLYDCNTFWPKVSFRSAAEPQAEYLYFGGYWIGGIVGNDTIVSTAVDGWQNVMELSPPVGPGKVPAPSVTCIPGPGDFAMRALSGSFWSAHAQPHWLPIRVATRSYAWHDSARGECIIYDAVITNTGSQTIQQTYVGLFFDGDVGDPNLGRETWQDDIVGSLPDDSIGYVIDNDGDMGAPVPATRAFAFKVLDVSQPVLKHSFNWWSPNTDPSLDWGPRKRANYRDLGTGGNGTPEGDTNKYNFLGNGEWDYDQVLVARHDSTDSIWIPWKQPEVTLLSRGMDARFLYSVGPVDLMPDSSFRFVFTTFTCNPVHSDTNNYKAHLVDAYEPETYLANLNLADLKRVAAIADSLADSLLDPRLPVLGLTAKVAGSDSALLEWDPWAYDLVSGYYVILDAIPKSAYVHPGVPPVWYHKPSPEVYHQLGRQYQDTVRGLNPYKAYACAVANRFGFLAGELSPPVIVKAPTPLTTPQLTEQVRFYWADSLPQFSWHPSSGGPVDHYNVYRYPESHRTFVKPIQRYYSTYRDTYVLDSVFVDTIWYYLHGTPVYATVASDDTVFIDSAPADSAFYIVAAVDSAGFETPFSATQTVLKRPSRNRDVLVVTKSVYYTQNYVQPDSIVNFYDRVLANYSHDYFMYTDSIQTCEYNSAECLDWRDLLHYRVVIVDDGLRDKVTRDFEVRQRAYSRYMQSGGTLVHCGAFQDFRDIDQSYPYFPSFPRWETTDALVQTFFGVTGAYYVGTFFHVRPSFDASVSGTLYEDTVLGFVSAESTGRLPSLAYDTTRYPFTENLKLIWPTNTAPIPTAFKHDSLTTVTHLFRSRYPSQSQVEGLPVGLHKQIGQGHAYTLGVHLWYLQDEGVRALIDSIMASVPPAYIVGAPEERPQSASLPSLTNWPNPFNSSTTISYNLARRQEVVLEIYNILGQRVRTLLDGLQSAGAHTLVWDGTGDGGQEVASGIYLYRLSAGSVVLTKKMLLLK